MPFGSSHRDDASELGGIHVLGLADEVEGKDAGGQSNFVGLQDGTGREGGLMTTAPALISACGAAQMMSPYCLALTRGQRNHPGQRACSKGTSHFLLVP